MGIWPAVVPEGDELTEILRLLFTPEEAEILSSDAFSAPFQDYKTAPMIAQVTGKPLEDVERILKHLEKRKLVFTFIDEKGDTYYSLFPAEPAVIGFFIESAEPKTQCKAAPLFETVFREKVSMGEGTQKDLWGRIIPVEEDIVVINEVLTFETVQHIMENARSISVATCFCKKKNPCHHPIEVCMAFDEGAEFVVSKGIARFIDYEEALEILKETERTGLIHISTNTKRGSKFVCNCCTCSCFLLKKLIEVENPRKFITTDVIPVINNDICILCEKCVDICIFGAFSFQGNQIYFNKNRCVGCGLCSHHCPVNAITMESEVVIAQNFL
jgi:electron transport complex protein RnfB